MGLNLGILFTHFFFIGSHHHVWLLCKVYRNHCNLIAETSYFSLWAPECLVTVKMEQFLVLLFAVAKQAFVGYFSVFLG